jgi:hypothetical protein
VSPLLAAMACAVASFPDTIRSPRGRSLGRSASLPALRLLAVAIR